MGKGKLKIQSPTPGGSKHILVPAAVQESPEQQPPLFSLRYIQRGYSSEECTKDEKAALVDTFHLLSQMTWAEINRSNRHGRGYERISRTQIKPAIPAYVTDDVNIIAFRFCGQAPMVGYRDGAVFYILWLDRAFTVYPH